MLPLFEWGATASVSGSGDENFRPASRPRAPRRVVNADPSILVAWTTAQERWIKFGPICSTGWRQLWSRSDRPSTHGQ